MNTFPIDNCVVRLRNETGDWVPHAIRDAAVVEGIVRDVVGGPALSLAGFEARYERNGAGARVMDENGTTFPMVQAEGAAAGHYALPMRAATSELGGAMDDGEPEENHAMAVTRSQARRAAEEAAAEDHEAPLQEDNATPESRSDPACPETPKAQASASSATSPGSEVSVIDDVFSDAALRCSPPPLPLVSTPVTPVSDANAETKPLEGVRREADEYPDDAEETPTGGEPTTPRSGSHQRADAGQPAQVHGSARVVVGTDRERRERNMEYHHQRLNHVRVSILNDFVRSGHINDGAVVQAVGCPACRIGKATRRAHSSRPIPTVQSKAGSWMQFDLLGPLPACGFHNYKYVFGGIDTSTGFVFAHFMESKSQVDEGYEALRTFMRKYGGYVEAKHGHEFKLDLFLMDSDSTVVPVHGRTMSKLQVKLKEDGVAMETTGSRDTPEWNAKIERFWRTLQETAEALLLASGADRSLFYFCALQHVIHTYNRLPTAANKLGNGEAPYTTLGIPFRLKDLVPFFSRATLWHGPKGSKGSGPKAKEVRIVGYNPVSQGCSYRYYDPDTGRLETSGDITIIKEAVTDARVVAGEEKQECERHASPVPVPEVARLSGNKAATRKVGTSLNDGAYADLRARDTAARKKDEERARASAVALVARAKATPGTVLKYEQRNPKCKAPGKAPSKSYQRYEWYKKCKTVEEFRAMQDEEFQLEGHGRGVHRKAKPGDLIFDLTHGYAVLIFPRGERSEEEAYFAAEAKEWARTSSVTQAGTRANSSDVTFPEDLSLMAATLVVGSRQGSLAMTVEGNAVPRGGSEQDDPLIPPVRNLQEAKQSEYWDRWDAARKKELSGLARREVWRVVRRDAIPPGTQVFPLKEIYDVVYVDKNGVRKIKKVKHRVTFRGDRSRHGRDYFETASCMARSESVRMVVAVGTAEGFEFYDVDHTQAFTQAPRDVELVSELPEMTPEDMEEIGMVGKCKEYVGVLQKTLYGEKPAGRAWQVMYDNWLVNELGATMCVHDRQVFTWKWKGHTMLMPTHVDDGLIAASDPAIVKEFMRRASEKFDVTGGGVAESILGMDIVRGNQTVTLSQAGFSRQLLDKFDVWTLRAAASPIEPNEKYEAYGGEPLEDDDSYMEKLGALNWLSCNTRPDLAYATSRLARAAKNPGPQDLAMMQRTLRYLLGTIEYGITYHASDEVLQTPYPLRHKLVAAVDSNYYHDGEKATSGGVIMLNGGAVAWKSNRQSVVTTSSTHAEVTAAHGFSQTILWARGLMEDLGFKQPTTRVLVDNKALCDQTVSFKELKKSQHYKLQQAWLEQCVRDLSLWMDHTAGDDNPADMFTKSNIVRVLETHRDRIMGVLPWIPLSPESRLIFEKGRRRYVDGGLALPR